MNAVPVWRPGFSNRGVDPTEAHAALLDVEREAGRLTPQAVVEAARPEGSTLHPIIFNITDEMAAEEYRLQRARMLIVNLVVRTEEEERPLRIHLTDADGPVYERVELLVHQPPRWQLAVNDARVDLRAAQRRVRVLGTIVRETGQRTSIVRSVERASKAIDRADLALQSASA